MKAKLKELDVDFIGGQGSLTKEEQERISEFLRSRKERKAKSRFAAQLCQSGEKQPFNIPSNIINLRAIW
jgi:hypothetical protein